MKLLLGCFLLIANAERDAKEVEHLLDVCEIDSSFGVDLACELHLSLSSKTRQDIPHALLLSGPLIFVHVELNTKIREKVLKQSAVVASEDIRVRVSGRLLGMAVTTSTIDEDSFKVVDLFVFLCTIDKRCAKLVLKFFVSAFEGLVLGKEVYNTFLKAFYACFETSEVLVDGDHLIVEGLSIVSYSGGKVVH
jgi:hypothetical protein